MIRGIIAGTRRRCVVAGATLFVSLCAGPAAMAAPPAWFLRAAALPTPEHDPDAPYAVLLDEGTYEFTNTGQATRTARYVVRVLTRDGFDRAVARVYYYKGASRVVSLNAWLAPEKGKPKSYGKNQAVDLAEDRDALFSDARVLVLSPGDDLAVGAVFGWEFTIQGKTRLGEVSWYFQSGGPVVRSAVILKVPEKWRVQAHVLNHEPFEPVPKDGGLAWELRDLPGVPDEDDSPARSRLAVRLSATILPGEETIRKEPWVAAATWDGISRQSWELHQAQVAATPEIEARVREVTGSADSDWERIRRIAEFAQKTRYIATAMDLEKGGGYTPRAAGEVFRCGWGDCKDKTNLMRSMLGVLGIRSFPVGAYWGDRLAIVEAHPAFAQFNHCIVAVAVDDSVDVPAVVEDPVFGRLLVFDPTDEFTPIGDLHADHQGSTVLVCAPENGHLVRLPWIPPELNRLDRTIKARLAADGSIAATMTEAGRGQEAVDDRRFYRLASRERFELNVRKRIERGVPVSTVSRIDVADSMEAGTFTLETEFTAPSYARWMRDRLLVFKPVMVERSVGLLGVDADRKLPIVLEPRHLTDRVEVELPAGLGVDEMPRPVLLEEDFGRYSAACRVEGGVLVVERSLDLKGVEVPVERVAALRAFFEKVIKSDQAPVVLERL